MSTANANQVVVIASDHNGNELRTYLRMHMRDRGIVCVDIGPVNPAKKVDYVDYAQQVGHAVSEGQNVKGVLICGTGIGMSIVANRFPRVRASMVTDIDSAHKTREHNDSNVLVLGAWKAPATEQVAIFDAWYDGQFGKGRHVPRIAKIDTDSKIALVPGVFNVLKESHVELLKFARQHGKVVVALANDEAARILKGSENLKTFASRKRVLESVLWVDEIIESTGRDVGALSRQVGASYVVKGDRATESVVRTVDAIPGDVQVVLFPIQEAS